MAPGMILDLLLSGMRMPVGITPYADDLRRAKRAYEQYDDGLRERMARAKGKSTGVGIHDPLFGILFAGDGCEVQRTDDMTDFTITTGCKVKIDGEGETFTVVESAGNGVWWIKNAAGARIMREADRLTQAPMFDGDMDAALHLAQHGFPYLVFEEIYVEGERQPWKVYAHSSWRLAENTLLEIERASTPSSDIRTHAFMFDGRIHYPVPDKKRETFHHAEPVPEGMTAVSALAKHYAKEAT